MSITVCNFIMYMHMDISAHAHGNVCHGSRITKLLYMKSDVSKRACTEKNLMGISPLLSGVFKQSKVCLSWQTGTGGGGSTK